MKNKILNSRPVQWLLGLKITKMLLKNRFTARIFNYEVLMYLFCGVLTTAVSYLSFLVMMRLLPFGGTVETLVANTVSFITAVLFAFIVNKILVFDSRKTDFKTLTREFWPFVGMRVLSYLLETAFIWLTADVLLWPKFLMKVVASIFVIVINYFISKFIVFNKKKGGDGP